MAKRRKQNSSFKNILLLVLIIAATLISVYIKNRSINNNLTLEDGNAAVYFLDVGQGNCTVIQVKNKCVIIDAGLAEYGSKIVDFMGSKGITEISYCICTHPHSDHIGGMATVIRKVKTGKVLMPDIDDEYLPVSKSFEVLLNTIDDNNIDCVFLNKNYSFDFEGVGFKVLTPVNQTEYLNNMSLMVKAVYGKTSFLIVGDAEKGEMYDIMSKNKKFDFSSTFYLFGHHGSESSLNETFLRKVNMRYVIISCGIDNSYGHPHKEVLSYLKKNNIEYFRTDLNGTITVITDGDTYKIEKEK